jgi:hypothetical protein
MDDPTSLYVSRGVVNAQEIIDWAKGQGFAAVLHPDDMHVTVALSKQPIIWPEAKDDQIIVPSSSNRSVVKFDGGAIVLSFESPELTQRWKDIINLGASWDHDGYHPHITLSYEAGGIDLPSIIPFGGKILLSGERLAEVNEDWIKKMSWSEDVMQKIGARHSRADIGHLQRIHDEVCALGAVCPAPEHGGGTDFVGRSHGATPGGDKELEKGLVRIAKVDDNLGMVFGYAVVCKHNGQDYYDLNVDVGGSHAGQRVPEHIPEAVMLKSAAEFMANAERPGNEMHKGDNVGSYVFAFPLTTDIAKALGISTTTTGLLVGFKPPPEMLAKFKDGTYKGFSIEGRRLSYEEME